MARQYTSRDGLPLSTALWFLFFAAVGFVLLVVYLCHQDTRPPQPPTEKKKHEPRSVKEAMDYKNGYKPKYTPRDKIKEAK